MGYRLTVAAIRVVQSDEKGKVTYRKRYKKGNIVDTSKMDPERVELFIEKGYLVDEDAEDAPEPVEETPEQEPVEESEPQEEAEGEDDEPTEEDDDEQDEYDEMSYPDLQQEAKKRDLNAGGSADDLRARLRESDSDES